MPENGLDEARRLLSRLKERLIAGELDEATYQRQRELIFADLAPAERAAFGTGTPTPQPSTPAPGTPAPGTRSPLGPSGRSGRGVRTSIPSLADLDLQPGSVLLGQWRLVRELGRGGFGAVFEAEELHLHEKQAVKVLDPAMVAKEELLARFRREVSLMRRLEHPRIVRVFDYREDLRELIALISMQLVAGGSVKQLLATARAHKLRIPVDLALEILGQTLEALAEAHAKGVIHRDVTPGNVLLAGGTPEELLAQPGRDPQVKLVDFGIAGLVERSELSQKSRVLGTAAYVAPEVLDPTVEVTPAADVYGAGAMGYELLTGELPVGRFEAVRELRPELAASLDGFVLSLLEKRPEKRPGAKAGAWGLRNLREEAAQTAARAEAERRAAAERAAREAAAAEQRRADEEQRRRAELARREAEEQARQEALRRAEQERARAEAERAARAVVAPPTSWEASAEKGQAARRSGVRGSVWVGVTAGLLAVALAVGWGISSKRAAEERLRAEQVRLEQEKQAAVAAEQRRAAGAAEAERQRQARQLEEEKQRAAQAERERIAREQEQAKSAEAARLEQERRAAAEAAQKQREQEAAAQRQREAEAAAQRQREAEAAAQRQREAEARAVAPAPTSVGVAGIRWVRIPSGSFTMGCTSGDSECFDDEKPTHRVTISRSYELASTETTVGQYQVCVTAGRCAAAGGSQGGSDHPVVNVSWEDARSFCAWAGGRLPTEAEWEYAARGGREGWKYPWGNEITHENANYGKDQCCGGLASGRDQWVKTSPVGSFAATGFGLYDMAGNVWEWVADWYGSYSGSAQTDPTGAGSGSTRVLRGGSWSNYPRNLRVSNRGGNAPGFRDDVLGFRCARTGNP